MKALPQIQQSEPVVASNDMLTHKAVDAVRKDGLVFEVGFTFVFMHYQSIFIGVMRCLFQSFRPLLILFVFGQILKAAFFIMGTHSGSPSTRPGYSRSATVLHSVQ